MKGEANPATFISSASVFSSVSAESNAWRLKQSLVFLGISTGACEARLEPYEVLGD